MYNYATSFLNNTVKISVGCTLICAGLLLVTENNWSNPVPVEKHGLTMYGGLTLIGSGIGVLGIKFNPASRNTRTLEHAGGVAPALGGNLDLEPNP